MFSISFKAAQRYEKAEKNVLCIIGDVKRVWGPGCEEESFGSPPVEGRGVGLSSQWAGDGGQGAKLCNSVVKKEVKRFKG